MLQCLFAAGVVDLIVNASDENHKIQEDENRDRYLASLVFTVLRFENRFVFRDPEYLKSEIKKVLNERNELNG